MTMTSNENGTTVVLGWDALDYELLHDFGLSHKFGAHVQPIETFANPVIDEPHTREVWPSIITGVDPDVHGIHAVTEGDGVQWDNPLLDCLSTTATRYVPQSVRTAIGKRLRERGAAIQQQGPEHYDDVGVSTVFDERRSLPLSVPNYQTEFDRRVGLTSDRDAIWEQCIGSKDGATGYAPSESMDVVEHVLFREAGERAGHVRAALSRDYDLVFCWFGLIDTAGHIEPAADDPLVERAYRYAADVTTSVRDALGPDDRLLVVSDHGLQAGEHTMAAAVAGDDDRLVSRIDSVFDVRNALEAATPSHRSDGPPPVRESDTNCRQAAAAPADEVRDRLETLGYV